MNAEATRFPLAWPVGWRRTQLRKRARFYAVSQSTAAGYRTKRGLTVAEATDRLAGELRRLGATQEILSTNLVLRLDGLPRSDQREPADPGAAVYFQLKGKPRCLACDRWDRVADNIAAIAMHVEAIRAVDRYGVGTLEQAFAGYAQLPASTESWFAVLGVPPTATQEQIDEAFRRLAKAAHPDAGGSHEAMTRLTSARDEGRRERGAA